MIWSDARLDVRLSAALISSDIELAKYSARLINPNEINSTITSTDPLRPDRPSRQIQSDVRTLIQFPLVSVTPLWFVRDTESIGTRNSIGLGVPVVPPALAGKIRTRTAIGRLVVKVESHMSYQFVPSKQENATLSMPPVIH